MAKHRNTFRHLTMIELESEDVKQERRNFDELVVKRLGEPINDHETTREFDISTVTQSKKYTKMIILSIQWFWMLKR
jgi:hypothetical protein